MSTSQTLRTFYTHAMRAGYLSIPAGDAAFLDSLASSVNAGSTSLASAESSVERLANATTSVATLSYQFFTGVIPFAGGIDYLVSPQGGNANNLNSAYYQTFNLENRYINFAVNLGKAGEGQSMFSLGYGALDLSGAVAKAYAAIFGVVPTDAKVASLIGDMVPNGTGGTETRGEYFAAVSGDGLNGAGTKAAAAGWMLAEAVKADLGPYALANDAFLADLGPDGLARFHSDLLATYGPLPGFATGATLNVGASQSVSTAQADPNLRSTNNNDTVTATSGLAGTVSTGDGHDLVTVSGGALSGFVDGQGGSDTITTAVLAAAVPVLGGGINGQINGGDGNDVINVTQNMANGAVIDGGAGDDTASVVFGDPLYNNSTQIVHVEHLVIAGDGVQFGGPDIGAIAPDALDIFATANALVLLRNVPDGVVLGLRNITSGSLDATYHVDLIVHSFTSSQVGSHTANLHLDNVNLPSDPTASPDIYVKGLAGPLHIHVDSNSIAGNIRAAEVDNSGSLVTMDGLGQLTAGFIGVSQIDATAAVAVNITRFGSNPGAYSAILSGGDDRIAVDLFTPNVGSVTLGAGSDRLSLYQDGSSSPRFSNVDVTGGSVDAYLTIQDFTKSVDHVDLGAAITSIVTGLSSAAAAATTLEQALIAVSAQTPINQTAVFEWANDTYIYHQDGTIGVNTGDGLIKLVGVTGLTIATGGGSADIHYG